MPHRFSSGFSISSIQYVKQFAGEPGVLAARLSVPDLREDLIAFLRQFYEKQYGGAPFVDKTPGLEAIVGAPFIQQAFPGAKIIVMERNGIEVIESLPQKIRGEFRGRAERMVVLRGRNFEAQANHAGDLVPEPERIADESGKGGGQDRGTSRARRTRRGVGAVFPDKSRGCAVGPFRLGQPPNH